MQKRMEVLVLHDLWVHITNVNEKSRQYMTSLFTTRRHNGYVKYIPVRKECETCPHYLDKDRDYVVENGGPE